MSDLKETQISSEKIFSGRLINLYFDQVKLPNGETSTREWIDHPGAVCLIPILADGNLCLIRQFRYGPREEFIEIPAGKLDDGEDPVDCAYRELEEETKEDRDIQLAQFQLHGVQRAKKLIKKYHGALSFTS